MAAADYYNSADIADPNRYAPVETAANKPLPSTHENVLPSPYADDLSYAQHHYSQTSVDTSYHPHAQSYAGSPAGKTNDPFSDDIPLHPTNTPAQPFPPPHHDSHSGKRHRKRARRPWRERPWFSYFMSVVQVAVFCGELARNAQLQGSPISTKPIFNPMIGPSTDCLINMGARFAPCMRVVEKNFNNTDPSMVYPCPNRTSTTLECSLGEWCGFGGQAISESMGGSAPDGSHPNQWWRFIVPMFYHAGLIHLAFNLFAQITLGGEIERNIGVIRFAIIYFFCGIFGFVLGGNLGSQGQPSVGASGCLFGIFALVLLDILYTWRERPKPVKDLLFLIVDMVICFVIGLLPGVDNFAHIGGFISGMLLGVAFMNSPNQLRNKISPSDPPYTAANPMNPYNTSSGDNNLIGFRGFIKQPVGFFKGRRPLWWAFWLVRAAMLTILLVVFIVLLNNFYSPNMKECRWCKYLSCLPVKNWCDMYDFKVTKVPAPTTTNPARLLRG